MARAISVRLDDEAERALRALEATGLTRSEAIRTALLGEVRHRRRSHELAAEAAALEADETDAASPLASWSSRSARSTPPVSATSSAASPTKSSGASTTRS